MTWRSDPAMPRFCRIASVLPRPLHAAMVLGGSILLGACTAPRPMADTNAPAPGSSRSASAIGFEKRLEESAVLADRQGRLADEATTLELLAILRPEERTLDARRQALQQRIAAATQDRLRRGADAQKRGALDAAMSQYLAALALAPDNETAANALRSIERERNRRTLLAKQRERIATPIPATGD